ncbi:hypothetical protein BOTBODRAFT_132671 [Botryobasidium botryosum FD-172 SS1]|uniref:J domain-containing protein n=1 Tax=Botryobasidium botryosum (strain FD-172 SS1) TaxID=930990 RepID=A0A067MF49_BOTB1|nr:hypothetical protein BOTBODRAFT_132671 [Botryobasidium botryosum FD-172 SS1]
MANYTYNESGMALYFALTFLALILIPLTLTYAPGRQKKAAHKSCRCPACEEKASRVKKARSSLPRIGSKAIFTIVGWAAFSILAYQAAHIEVENSVYDPFSILGIRVGSTKKDIKRHYKKLSLKFHPDKVQLAENQTMDDIMSHFVDITKAYKALTDETIRNNVELYGHPDGKQEFSMGIAIPLWVVESRNNAWVLSAYGLIFGLALPALVYRWWFGSRQYTKDGVKGRTAEHLFKSTEEQSQPDDLLRVLGKGYEYEFEDKPVRQDEISKLTAKVKSALGDKWRVAEKLESPKTVRALTLIYAHLLRIPVTDVHLQKEQADVLLATPALLNSLLSIILSHNWLSPALHAMRLHAYLAQALFPGSNSLLQFPGVTQDDVASVSPAKDLARLEDKWTKDGDARVEGLKKASERWGHLEVADARFRVIGERLVTPGAIVQLVFKVRLAPPNGTPTPPEAEKSAQEIKADEEKDNAFLVSKKEAEDLEPGQAGSGLAHAPYWPEDRKPSWWILIGDVKANRVIVPPMRFSDVPYSDPSRARNYRTYKLQFQAPPNPGAYPFQFHIVSDTFVGEHIQRDVILKIEDLSSLTADEQGEEDDISEPDEDSLAGQMAAFKGAPVKRRTDDSDDESTTDGDQDSDDDDDSDSD